MEKRWGETQRGFKATKWVDEDRKSGRGPIAKEKNQRNDTTGGDRQQI